MSPLTHRRLPPKPKSEIVSEIQTIMRQIAASVSFLPLSYNEEVSFEILVHTEKGLEVPVEWEESDPRFIKAAQQSVQLQSFSTDTATVGAFVNYKLEQ